MYDLPPALLPLKRMLLMRYDDEAMMRFRAGDIMAKNPMRPKSTGCRGRGKITCGKNYEWVGHSRSPGVSTEYPNKNLLTLCGVEIR